LHAPDILVIDDEVPNIDPIAFARDLRKLAGVHEPLIVLIGSREGPLAENSRCGGIDVFLPKPVDTKFFMAMLYQAVKLRAARIDLIATRALA
jgi:CheY-like chemotaxis protein